jgi:L,D-transpeptidase catalytic domain
MTSRKNIQPAWIYAAGALLAAFSTAVPATAKPEAISIELGYPAGSVVIVNTERKVYYVTGPGTAIRYGVAVGKASELWTGRTFISEKKVDPKWIPIDGAEPVEGGDPSNPLGKRALYLDWSLLRIHGTPSRGSIGSAVSNGCIRMLNEDVMDLFERVHIGAPVFAINSRKDAGSFKTAKVGDLVYVNPEVRRDAKEEESEEQMARAEPDERERRPSRPSSSWREYNPQPYYAPTPRRYREYPRGFGPGFWD